MLQSLFCKWVMALVNFSVDLIAEWYSIELSQTMVATKCWIADLLRVGNWDISNKVINFRYETTRISKTSFLMLLKHAWNAALTDRLDL